MDTKAKVMEAARAAVKAVGSQRKLAQLMHVTDAAVSHWTHGEKCSLDAYLTLLEVAKSWRTGAANVLGALTAVTALISGSPLDANAGEKSTAGKNQPGVVYYVKWFVSRLSRLLSAAKTHGGALPALPGL